MFDNYLLVYNNYLLGFLITICSVYEVFARFQVSKFQESSDNQEALLNSANVTNEDITKDYQVIDNQLGN